MNRCLWSCPEPEQSWAFPKRLGLFQRGLITIYYNFQKLIESPTTVRKKDERDIPGPWDNLKGKSCLADSFLIPWPCPRDNLEGKSCLADSFLILWPCPRDNLEGKSCLAGSFLIPWPCPWDNLEGKSCLAGSFLIPVAPEGTYWAPGAAPCGEELPCRFLSRPMTLSLTGCMLAAPNR